MYEKPGSILDSLLNTMFILVQCLSVYQHKELTPGYVQVYVNTTTTSTFHVNAYSKSSVIICPTYCCKSLRHQQNAYYSMKILLLVIALWHHIVGPHKNFPYSGKSEEGEGGEGGYLCQMFS